MMRMFDNHFLILYAVILLSSVLYGQDSSKVSELEKRIRYLEEKLQRSELDDIIKDAEREAKSEDKSQSKIFKSGQRSLQAINPEISITGDAFGLYVANNDGFNEEMRSGAHFRVLGLHMQSNPDPFSMAKVAIEFTPGGVGFGEAYLTWINLLPGINLTAGKFRQQFGIVNRWHEHALDQFDFPLALQTILGEEGLNQTGISMDWNMPAFMAHANGLTVQITSGQNEHLFSGEAFSFPAVLGRFKSYYDLTENTYLEIGLTSMAGQNNIRGFMDDEKIMEDARYTILGGLDLTLFWEPLNQAKYHSFLWRSEIYYADKEEPAGGRISAYGGYTYAEYKFNERWHAGARIDYTQPFLLNNDDMFLYQIVPYVTWWQSHWVKIRLQLNLIDGKNVVIPDNILRLQLVWSAGPHKHDRY